MEIILSNQCQSLTGSLGQGFGYSIQKQHGKFVSKRNSKGKIPRDGHLRFILACAELAQMKLHISDIRVSATELRDALREAECNTPLYGLTKYHEDYPEVFSATDIINYRREHLHYTV